jgi:hypothetical protein
MVFSLWLWPRTKSRATKNTRQMLAILKAMRIRRCNAGRIAQWSASVAACGATRCRHWTSARAVLPRQAPWLTILNETKNTNKTQLLPNFITVDRRKKARHFQDLKRALYSRHQCNKLRTNVKDDYSSWRAQLHFELSNIVNGQKLEKLLTLNEAQENLWAKYGHIG